MKSFLDMRFEYKRYHGITDSDIGRPVIPITLYNPHAESAPSIGYHGLVDSGADFCVFSREIAELLEIDLTAGERYSGTGPVASESRLIYFHEIEIGIGPYGSRLRVPVWAGFMPDLTDSGYGLLGRHGFSSGLTFVKFKETDSLLEIGKQRRV